MTKKNAAAGPMKTGVLYLCGTPIGNLEDITLRALRILKEVHLIAAEDTRRTAVLLSHYDIHTKMMSYREENRIPQGRKILRELKSGRDVALVSDAGMPGISDPAAHLVVECIREGIRVVPIPGPTAIIAALVTSGLPTDRFVFEGFLPRRGKKRRMRLRDLAREERTMILYEAPHRLRDTLRDSLESLGNRPACLLREMTKKFEEARYGHLSDFVEEYSTRQPIGEYTLVIAGAEPGEQEKKSQEDLALRIKETLQQGLKPRETARRVSREFSIPAKEAYLIAIRIRKEEKGGDRGRPKNKED